MTNMLRRLREKDRQDGFTLIELMVVVMIIAILIAIAVPSFFSARKRAQDSSAKSSLQVSLTNAQAVYSDTQAYPASAALATTLSGEEPNITFQTGASTGPKVVSLATSESTLGGGVDTVVLAAKSQSGRCFFIRHIATPGATGAGTSKQDGTPASCDPASAVAASWVPA